MRLATDLVRSLSRIFAERRRRCGGHRDLLRDKRCGGGLSGQQASAELLPVDQVANFNAGRDIAVKDPHA